MDRRTFLLGAGAAAVAGPVSRETLARGDLLPTDPTIFDRIIDDTLASRPAWRFTPYRFADTHVVLLNRSHAPSY